MKLINKSPFDRHRAQPISITQAVGSVIERGADGYDGSIERAQGRIAASEEMLGRLIDTLSERGVLQDSDVATVIGYPYEVADEA